MLYIKIHILCLRQSIKFIKIISHAKIQPRYEIWSEIQQFKTSENSNFKAEVSLMAMSLKAMSLMANNLPIKS